MPDPSGSGGSGARSASSSRSLRRLDRLHDVPLNYEPPATDTYDAGAGWVIDSYTQPLPGEAPGAPEAGGVWEVAQAALRDYEFADPRLIRAVYYPERDLAGRTMLLVGRFGPLRFHMGARVYAVVDETRLVEGREVRVWGWGYQTLRGHLETGRMRFQVWKWLDDGAVEFHLEAASRAARIANPIVRAGFRVFGRRLQLRFARRACERMDAIVRARLAGRVVRESTGDSVDVAPITPG
ncbi:MAG: hypothetical protein JWN72_506 [Thermoleophilia bacterium]|nr:hypothetical protein [Thermoleophilia bacterium]